MNGYVTVVFSNDKYATKYMLKQGFGRIINISSTSGL